MTNPTDTYRYPITVDQGGYPNSFIYHSHAPMSEEELRALEIELSTPALTEDDEAEEVPPNE